MIIMMIIVACREIFGKKKKLEYLALFVEIRQLAVNKLFLLHHDEYVRGCGNKAFLICCLFYGMNAIFLI